MIAVWMLSAIVFALLLALLGALLEPILLRARWPVRGLWTVLLISASAFPVLRAQPSSSERVVSPVVPSAAADQRDARLSAGSASTSGSSLTRSGPPAGSTTGVISGSAAARVSSSVRDYARTAQPAESSTARRITTEIVDDAIAHTIARATPWDRPLLVLWGATTLSLLVSLILLALVTHRQSRGVTALGMDDDMASHDADSCGDVSRRAAPVLLTDDLGPAATGIVHPRILLPRWALTLDPVSRALMLRHEREHLAARDPALLLLSALIVALLPWNVPLWWIARRLRTAIELDCDARVLRRTPDVRRYAELLVLVGERASRSTPAWSHAPLLMLTARRSALLRRLDVMTHPRAGSRRTASALCACALVAVVLLGVAVPAPRPSLLAQSTQSSTSRSSFANLLAASQRPVSTDSAFFDMRAVFGAGALFTGHGWHPLLTPTRWSPRLFEYRAPRERMTVTSMSGRPVTVLLYVETPAGSMAPADTQRFVTPFQLSRTFSARPLHLRSARGDRFYVSAEIATAPGFRETVTGAHIVVDGRMPGSPEQSVTWINPGRPARCGGLLRGEVRGCQ